MACADILRPGENIRPTVTIDECKILINKWYGLNCTSIIELNSYDDKNYNISVSDEVENNNIGCVCEDGYVLKIMNSLDSKNTSFIEAQGSVMIFLNDNDIACPTPVKNRFGEYYSTEALVSGKHVIRLLKFVPGSILHQVPPSPTLYYDCGKFAATVDNALQKFHHSAYDNHKTLWMLSSVPQLRQFLFSITDEEKKSTIQNIIKEFEERVLENEEALEKGLIHGDVNEQNIVVEKQDGIWTVKAILDFGDANISCYLYELAITMLYMMLVSQDLDAGGYVIAGYSSVRNIPELDFSLLKVCVAARLCQSLVMGAYTSLQDPGNNYVLTTSVPGWKLLYKIWQEPEERLLKRWRDIEGNFSKKCSEES